MSIELVIPSNHLHPLLSLLLLPLIFPSTRVFSNESVLHIRWPEYLSFSFSVSPSNEYSGMISFRIDWFDLIAVQGMVKSLFQQIPKHQFSVLSLLYAPILTCVHDYWNKCGHLLYIQCKIQVGQRLRK